MTLPLFAIFKRKYLFNTLTGCLWMAANFCVYYSIWAMFSTYLQKELGWTPPMVAIPVFWANILVFLASGFWGGVAERGATLAAIILPASIAIFVTPLYLWTTDPLWIIVGLSCRASSAATIRPEPGLSLGTLPDRGPGHGGGLRLPSGRDLGRPGGAVLTYFAVRCRWALRMPMMFGTIVLPAGRSSFAVSPRARRPRARC